MHCITKAMKLISFALLVFLLFPSLYAFQQHDSSLSYTHPAIVVSGGVSYISVKNVDVYIPITDTEYWTPLLSTAPSSDPGDPPASEPSDSNFSNLTPPEDNATTENSSGSRLINLSTRAYIGDKSAFQEMVGGFGIRGSEPVKLFIRGYGPHLAQWFGADAISDPIITIKTFPGNENVLTNSQWNPADPEWAEISDAYQPSESGDCGAFITVNPGLYTTEVNIESGSGGIGMIEIFTYDDLTSKSGDGPVGNGSASLSKLINLSTRAYIGEKSNFKEMVGGFGIRGTDPLKLFIRGYGPHLSQWFGADAISDPEVTVKTFPGNVASLDNSQWNSSDSEWADISDAYQPSTSGDLGAFITVEPGLFTTEINIESGTGGIGMIEIFTYEELTKK